MRTILAGINAFRRNPLAAVPLAAEGLIGGLLVLAGAIPASSAGVASTAAFPLDIFFDLKQSIAFGQDWTYVIAALGFAVLLRGGVLAATLWLNEERPGSFVLAWARGCRIAAIAVVVLLPSAILFFAAAATRYAPFIYIGALLGLIPSVLLARKGAKIDVGGGEPQGAGVPEAPNFITYAYIVTAFGAAMTVLSSSGKWPAALLLMCLGPLHALFLLGWREHLKNGTFPGGGMVLTTVTVLLLAILFSITAYDRYIRDPAPVRRAPAPGMLIVLGGVDSSSRSGALADLDPRTLGFQRGKARQLSYRGPSQPYKAEDTHVDLEEAAQIIARQIARATLPRSFIGHSQAGLILDRIAAEDLALPERAVLLAAPPAEPPDVEVPTPDESGPGRAGGDLTRLLSWGLEKIGLQPIDVDSPASPTHLEKVVARNAPVPRLAVWALADSVWLEGDWRRPGETNIVAITDHVGVTDNGEAQESAREFFEGKRVADDESSWKGVAVGVLKYAFAPWRPR
jgi:hypothetical protein